MNTFIEFFQNVYYHCVHYIVNKKFHWIERLFWLIFIILSMALVMFIVRLSVDFFYHTKATIRLRTDYLDFDTPFPAVFFCENREISGKISKMLEEFNFTLNGNSKANIEHFVRTATFIRPMASYPAFPSCGQDEEACRFINTFKNNISAFGKHIRASCEEIFSSCTFNGQHFDCCDDFLPVDTFEGKCYAINSFNAITENTFLKAEKYNQIVKNRPLNTSAFLKYRMRYRPRMNPANLSVELDHTYLNVWYIGNTYLPTKMFQKDNQFSVMDVKHRLLDIYLRVEETLPDRSIFDLEVGRRNCRFWYENETMTSLKVFSISGCEMDCIRKAQLLYCGCVLHVLPNQHGLKDTLCDTIGLVCTFKRTEIVKYLSFNCSCVTTCTFLEVFPVGLTKYEINERDFGNFRNSRSKRRLNFLVHSPTVQYRLHAYKEPLDFIVDIGGAISLCIGCSFLSLAQILYYFLLKPLNDYSLKRKQENIIIKKRKNLEKAFLKEGAKWK